MPPNPTRPSSACKWPSLFLLLSSGQTCPFSETPHFSGTPCTPSDPHSNAVVDLNGDCLAGAFFPLLAFSPAQGHDLDLFLMCDAPNGRKSFQIWINNKDAGFSLGLEGQLPPGVQSVSFADMGAPASPAILLAPVYQRVFPQTETVPSTSSFRRAPRYPHPPGLETTARSTSHTTNSFRSARPPRPESQGKRQLVVPQNNSALRTPTSAST